MEEWYEDHYDKLAPRGGDDSRIGLPACVESLIRSLNENPEWMLESWTVTGGGHVVQIRLVWRDTVETQIETETRQCCIKCCGCSLDENKLELHVNNYDRVRTTLYF